MVLTSCLMAKTELLQEVYRRFTNTFFKDAMKFNGEDIVINMINGKSMAWNWEKYFIFKTQIPFLTFNKKKMVSGSVNHEISKKPDHVKERSSSSSAQKLPAQESPSSSEPRPKAAGNSSGGMSSNKHF